MNKCWKVRWLWGRIDWFPFPNHASVRNWLAQNFACGEDTIGEDLRKSIRLTLGVRCTTCRLQFAMTLHHTAGDISEVRIGTIASRVCDKRDAKLKL